VKQTSAVLWYEFPNGSRIAVCASDPAVRIFSEEYDCLFWPEPAPPPTWWQRFCMWAWLRW